MWIDNLFKEIVKLLIIVNMTLM